MQSALRILMRKYLYISSERVFGKQGKEELFRGLAIATILALVGMAVLESAIEGGKVGSIVGPLGTLAGIIGGAT